LLDSSRAAMRERRYTEPEGDNALNYYRFVLAQEPDNGEAREGMQRIAAVLHERVQVAIDENRNDAASRTLAQLRLIRADDPALPQFDAALANARIRTALDEGNVERASNLLKQSAQTRTLPPEDLARWRTELDRQQAGTRAKQLAALVSARIRQGKLLEPSADSAKHYLSDLRALPRDPAGLVDNATAELQQAYLKMLRDATAKGQPAEADRWKSEARALGVKPAELSAVQRDATARATLTESKDEGARLAQLVQDRIADGRLLEPVGDSAVFHLDALRAMEPSASAVAKNTQALSAKLLARARSALAAHEIEAARKDTAASRQLGVNLEAVAALERDILAAGPTSRPEQLIRTRYVAPEYPSAALKQNLRGEVHLRLTVDASGKVKDVVVVQSNPRNVFDKAAIAAARRWRFKPSADKDSGVETTANASIVFQPEDKKR
jgi:periplasmic protein TonB